MSDAMTYNNESPSPVNIMLKQRLIMFTLCLSDEMFFDEDPNEQCKALTNGILSFLSMLNVEDQICFNIGDTKTVLLNDAQANLTSWRQVKKHYKELINGTNSSNMFLNDFLKNPQFNLKNNNDLKAENWQQMIV
jgi:hypothetical protein